MTHTNIDIERQPAPNRAEGRRRNRVPAVRPTDPSPSEVSAPVAYPGPAGSHTAAAAAALFPSARLLAVPGFRAVAEAVASAEAGPGLLATRPSFARAAADAHGLHCRR